MNFSNTSNTIIFLEALSTHEGGVTDFDLTRFTIPIKKVVDPPQKGGGGGIYPKCPFLDPPLAYALVVFFFLEGMSAIITWIVIKYCFII